MRRPLLLAAALAVSGLLAGCDAPAVETVNYTLEGSTPISVVIQADNQPGLALVDPAAFDPSGTPTVRAGSHPGSTVICSTTVTHDGHTYTLTLSESGLPALDFAASSCAAHTPTIWVDQGGNVP